MNWLYRAVVYSLVINVFRLICLLFTVLAILELKIDIHLKDILGIILAVLWLLFFMAFVGLMAMVILNKPVRKRNPYIDEYSTIADPNARNYYMTTTDNYDRFEGLYYETKIDN